MRDDEARRFCPAIGKWPRPLDRRVADEQDHGEDRDRDHGHTQPDVAIAADENLTSAERERRERILQLVNDYIDDHREIFDALARE